MNLFASAPLRGLFITGTDTGIGKTRISCALLHLLGADGTRVAGFKPVAAGLDDIDGERINEDVHALRAGSSVALSAAEVSPYQLEAACAPHIAAALQDCTIERPTVLASAHALAARAELLLVEGVGGFRVPFGDDWDSADLACDLGLPVLLVVGLRLGCLNHALLSAEAIRSRGLHLVGWVANTIDPAMPHTAQNLQALARGLGPAPCLGVVPWLAKPTPQAVAAHLGTIALRAALDI